MSLFGNLSKKGLEESQDRVGGFGAIESDYYPAVIKQAYVTIAKSGAKAVNFEFAMPGGKNLRNTIYVTDKEGKNYFLNKDDNTKKVPLPGFTVVDDICLCTVEKDLSEIDIEEKVVKIYDFEQKKEVPTSVPVLVELLGKTVGLGVLKVLENKSAKDSNDVYQPTAETREINEIDKVFHDESGFTVVEVRAELEEPTFRAGWIERNKGKTRDKRKIKEGQSGAPASSKNAPAPTATADGGARKSLFGKK